MKINIEKYSNPAIGLLQFRDVLAIGKFGTIPDRPVQSRPVRSSPGRFGPAYIISKIYYN